MVGKRANGEGSIFPYRNGFAAYVWVTKPDGKRDRAYVYGKTREDVHDKWIKLHNRARQGTVATSVPTVERYATYWLNEVVRPNLAPGTFITYETINRNYIVPGLGCKRIDKLQPRDVQTWLNSVGRSCQCCEQGKDARRKEGRCCAVGRCCQSRPSAATIAHIRVVLRTLLSQAIVDELIARNVAKFVKVPPVRTHSRKAWSSDEARRFLESAKTDEDPLYAAYVLVLVLGLRKGEMLGLAWGAVDWDRWDLPCGEHATPSCPACQGDHAMELQIEWQLQRVGTDLIRRETKTPSSDSGLPLPAICATALQQHRIRQDAASEEAGRAWQASGLVFTTRFGTPIEPRNFNRYWDRRCDTAGVRRITVRDARRTCASLLADLDVHPRVAMRILRHAQFSITMEIYTVVSSKATWDALTRLGESLN